MARRSALVALHLIILTWAPPWSPARSLGQTTVASPDRPSPPTAGKACAFPIAGVRTLPLPETDHAVLSINADGSHLVTSRADLFMRFWDASTGRLIRSIPGMQGEATIVALSPTGDLAASGGYADFGLTKEEQDHLNEMTKGPIFVSVGLSAHGLGGSLRVWDLRTGRLLRTLAEGKKPFVSALAFTADEKELVVLSKGPSVSVWETRTWTRTVALDDRSDKLDHPMGGDGLHPAAPISADGQRTVCLDVACPSQPLLACDLRKARWRILDGGKETIGWLGLSPDGTKIATADWQSQIAIRDFDNGTAIQSIKGAAGKSPSCVKFSPDGKRIALGDEEGAVHVWEVETGHLVGTFDGPKGQVRDLVFVTGGLRIVSGGVGSTKERDPRTGGQRGVPAMIWDAKLK